jgi:hypothetical protein
MNKELLLKVRDHIGAEVNRLAMSTGARFAKEGTRKSLPLLRHSPPYVTEEVKAPACGTLACIAGWSVILSDQHRDVVRADDGGEQFIPWIDIKVLARDVLRLGYQQAEKLFYVDYWPEPYRTNYLNASSQAERTPIAMKRIDYFIQTDGEDC